MSIETLTEAERATLAWPMPHRAEAKALRIIDQQAKILEAARSVRCHWSPEAGYYVRLVDLHDALGIEPGDVVDPETRRVR